MVGNMGRNSCWSKPILETRVFAKGRASFQATRLLAQDGGTARRQCRDGPAGVSREPTFGARARPGMQEAPGPGGLRQGWQDSVTKSRAVPTSMGCRWADGDSLCGDDTLALQSPSHWSGDPFPSHFRLLDLVCVPQNPRSNLGNLSQRKGRFRLFVYINMTLGMTFLSPSQHRSYIQNRVVPNI